MRSGISPKTATDPSLPCMNGTILRTNMQTGGCAICARDRAQKSSCEIERVQPDLFGAVSSATGESQGSTVPSSAMKVRSYRPSLSDRLTISLMRSGLVAGITPTSIRRRSGAPIPDSASNWLVGKPADTRKTENSFSNGEENESRICAALTTGENDD